MIPTTFGLLPDNPTPSAQTSPELRRMDMYNRARREEMDAMLYNLNPRQTATTGRSRTVGSGMTAIGKLFHGVRQGIGSALITAGNRIQSPA